MISIKDVEDVILRITERIIEIRDELTEIDSKLGDGDMGISMGKGAEAVACTARSFEGDDFRALFIQCASALNKAAPSTMGTLLSGGLLALARYLAGKTVITHEDISLFPEVISEAIAKRGKAHVGDKTILDSMVPYADALKTEYARSGNLETAKKAALEAAKEGVEATKGMTAKTGRASWLGERNKEFPDAGAYMFYRIMQII